MSIPCIRHLLYLFAAGGFFFWPHHVACEILVSPPGIKPTPHAGEVRSLKHWTAREVLMLYFYYFLLKYFLILFENSYLTPVLFRSVLFNFRIFGHFSFIFVLTNSYFNSITVRDHT